MSISALSTALCLPALDIEALLQGRTIAAISDTFRNPSRFLLFPVDLPFTTGQLETQYQAQFLNSFKATYTSVEDSEQITVYAWAKCKTCRIFGKEDNLAALAALTAWTPSYLHNLTQERHKIFVLFLQVHRFVDPLKLVMPRIEAGKVNTYVQVPGTWSDQGAMALLDDETFAFRQKQLIKLAPPLHLELQALQKDLVFEREYSLGAMALDRDVRYLLGWSRAEETLLYDSDLSWIQQVTAAGDSDDSEEFAELVRRCLVKLGFIDQVPLDSNRSLSDAIADKQNECLYCDVPYSLIAESKTSHSISNSIAEGLLQKGNAPLSQTQFDSAVKLIFAAKSLTEYDQHIANREQINVIRPETLQKLTELKARYPGAIDLLKLKAYLQTAPYGEDADAKVDQFIAETLFQLRVRAAVIQAVKIGLERTGQESIGTDMVCSTYATFSQAGLPRLSMGDVQDMLVELSSPVAGYLGRDRAANGRALFYFLRELSVEDNTLISAVR